MKLIKLTILIYFGLVLFNPGGIYAQADSDSILSQANKLIYENPDKAIEIALNAAMDPETSTNQKVKLLLIVSTAYSSKRDYEKSLEYALEVTTLIDKIDDKKQKINVLNRIGGQYQQLKIYDKAIEYLDNSLAIIEGFPNQDSIQSFLGHNYALRGFIYREQMSCEIALTYFDKAINAYIQTLQNPMMNANVSICFYNKGNCQMSLNQFDDAEKSFLQSIDYAKIPQSSSLIAFAQKGLAEVKTNEKKYQEAIILLEDAMTNAENVGDKILNQGLYEGLSNNYLALNDLEKYSLFKSKFLALKRETKNSERKSINQSLVNLTESKAKEIELLHKKYIPILIIIASLIVITIVFLIRYIIKSQRQINTLKKELK